MKNYTVTTKDKRIFDLEFSDKAEYQIRAMAWDKYSAYTVVLGVVDKFHTQQQEVIVIDEIYRKGLYIQIENGNIITIVGVVSYNDILVRAIETRRMQQEVIRFTNEDMR